MLPAFLFLAVMTPAVIGAVMASVLGLEDLDLLRHDDYYQIVAIILVLFSAIIAPELLCPDRRGGVISLYLVRPLTTTDYLAGRWLAFFSVTLALAGVSTPRSLARRTTSPFSHASSRRRPASRSFSIEGFIPSGKAS